nr:alpha/beta hydrolase [Rhodococcus sp. (in: high G+C Gram-positive bacteria)]
MTKLEPTVVIVPGLRDHVEDHWQTLLAVQLDRVRTVPPPEHDKLNLTARIDALDTVLSDIAGPVTLIAHSAGVMITVQWAQNPTRHIVGALLAAPADVEVPFPAGYPQVAELEENGWLPIPRGRLPFPSIVACSANDPLGDRRRIAGMAESWGSRLVNLGNVGHLNPASGYGSWPQAATLLAELTGSTFTAESQEIGL